MKSLFIFGVWGSKYIDRFLKYGFKSTIEAIKNADISKDSTVWIYTKKEDLEKFGGINFNWKKNSEIDICVKTFAISSNSSKYSQLAKIHSQATKFTNQFDCIFLGYADAIYSKNSYKFAIEKITQGYDVVYCMGLPVDENAFIRNAKLLGRQSLVGINEGEMQEITLKSLHPMVTSTIIPGKSPNISSYCSWRTKCGSLICRSVHLHPVVISTRRKDVALSIKHSSSLDETFTQNIGKLKPKPNIYVVNSGFDLIAVSLVPKFTRNLYASKTYKTPFTYENIHRKSSFFQRFLFTHPTIFYSKKYSPQLIKESVIESGIFTDKINFILLNNIRHVFFNLRIIPFYKIINFLNSIRLIFTLNKIINFLNRKTVEIVVDNLTAYRTSAQIKHLIIELKIKGINIILKKR